MLSAVIPSEFSYLAMLIALPSGVSATATLIPLEDFARGAEVASVKVSPDGRWLARIETVDGRGSITVVDRAGRNRRLLARNPDRSIDNVAWSGDGRYLFYFLDSGGDEGYHLFRINPFAAKAPPVDLTPFKGASVELIEQPPTAGHSVMLTLDRRDPRWPDPYRLDLATGSLSEVTRNNGRITTYFANSAGRISAAESIRPDGILDVLVPTSQTGWRKVYTASLDERFKSLRIDPAGQTLFARSNAQANRDRLISIDLKTGRTRRIDDRGCGPFDVEDVFLSTGQVATVACTKLRRELVGASPRFRSSVAAARQLLGQDSGLSLESRDRNDETLIFHGDRSDLPGRYVMVGREGARVVALTRPWLERKPLAKARTSWLTARDGLRLLTYVTRPIGASGPGPAILAIHGGPWSRDTGEFESTNQLLANRGYTVIQVNFRGSTGLGKAVFEGGVREFGRRMSDDIDDAARWAIAQGIADPDRICLLGGSYGGFATLSGLALGHQKYRCGVDYAGPANLVTLMEAFPRSWSSFLPRSWYRFVGRPDRAADRQEMIDRSPLTHSDRIAVPLLVFQGANDPRVTQAQSDAIVCSLRQRSIPTEYLLASREGHSFANEETSLAVNRATELFFARNLGGRAQDQVRPEIDAALTAM